MKKKLMLGLPLLLIGGGAAAYMTGQLDAFLGTPEEAESDAPAEQAPPLPPSDTAFMPMKNLGISVIDRGRVVQVIYLDLALEIQIMSQPLAERHWARLLDRVQVNLRELFSYRTLHGLPPIDVAEMKSVVLQVGRRLFGEGVVVDVHLISDWVMEPGT